MGKGGKDSNPILPRNAENTVDETDRDEAAKGDAMRVLFEAEA